MLLFVLCQGNKQLSVSEVWHETSSSWHNFTECCHLKNCFALCRCLQKIWTQINGGDWENTDTNWWWWLRKYRRKLMVVTEKIWTQINGGNWENTDANWWWWLNASMLLFVLCPSLSCHWSSSPENFSCSFKTFSYMCVLCVFSAMPLQMMPTGQCVTEVWTSVSSSPGRVARGKQVMVSLDKLGSWTLKLVQRQCWGNVWETGWNAYRLFWAHGYYLELNRTRVMMVTAHFDS